MIDSDTEDVAMCKTRDEAIQLLGEKGARIWDWLRGQERQIKEPIDIRLITGRITFDRGLLDPEPVTLTVQVAVDASILGLSRAGVYGFVLAHADQVCDALHDGIRERYDQGAAR